MDEFIESLAHFGDRLKALYLSVNGIILSFISMIIALSNIQRAILTLIFALMLDFITGCIASWVERRKNGEPASVYFLESGKLRKSVVKAGTYMMLIIFTWLLSALFFDQRITLIYSTKNFTAVELVIGVCIAIEVWSNLENSKRAGFDVLASIKDIAKNLWKVAKTIKTGE